MTTDSTVAPRAHAIDPKMFLDYFTACGGGYCLTPDRQLWLGILQTGTTKGDRTIAAQIMREVTPADAERIKAYLEAKEKGESEMADNWSAAMTRFRIAERAYQDCASAEVVDDEKADELCDIESDARWALMGMPARIALRCSGSWNIFSKAPTGRLIPTTSTACNRSSRICVACWWRVEP